MPVAAVVAVSALYVGIATAAPRDVAIVNATSDQKKGAELAMALRGELTAQKDLAPIQEGDVARALEDALKPIASIDPVLAQARLSIQRARDAQAVADYDAALAEISAGESVLLGLPHAPQVIALFSELNFEAALIHIRRGDPASAVMAFRAVRRLDANRGPLDPRDYQPDVITAFDEAKPLALSAKVTVSSPFDGYEVWVDGVRVGVTKLTVELSPGIHYVTVETSDYQVVGQRMELAPGSDLKVDLRFTRENTDTRIRNRRRAIVDLDATETAAQPAFRDAARYAADAAGVDAVVLISDDGGELATAVYSGKLDSLSAWRPVQGATLEMLVAPFIPVDLTPPPGDDDDDDFGGTTRDTPWWKKRTYWVPIAVGTTLAAAAAVITFALGGGETFTVDPGCCGTPTE